MRPLALPETICFNEKKVARLRRRIPDQGTLAHAVRRYRALGHSGRLAVLNLLSFDECCVCDVAHVLKMPLSTASQHLHELKRGGLVKSRRQGKFVFYSPASDLARQLASQAEEKAK